MEVPSGQRLGTAVWYSELHSVEKKQQCRAEIRLERDAAS